MADSAVRMRSLFPVRLAIDFSGQALRHYDDAPLGCSSPASCSATHTMCDFARITYYPLVDSSKPRTRLYPLQVGCGFVLAGIASFTLVYFLQRVAPRGWEDGNQWLFAIPPLLAAIITSVIVSWVIDRTARTTAAFGAAFVTAPFISMCLMLLLRAIPGVN
jgi:hypothetical protein